MNAQIRERYCREMLEILDSDPEMHISAQTLAKRLSMSYIAAALVLGRLIRHSFIVLEGRKLRRTKLKIDDSNFAGLMKDWDYVWGEKHE